MVIIVILFDDHFAKNTIRCKKLTTIFGVKKHNTTLLLGKTDKHEYRNITGLYLPVFA